MSTASLRIGRRQQRHVAAIGAILLCVGGVAWLGYKLNTGAVFAIDTAVLLAIHNHTTAILDAMIVHTTDLAGPTILVGVGLLIGALLLARKRYTAGILTWAIMFGAGALVYGVKLFIERPRPSLWSDPLVHETGFSFVSGHATMSTALALAVIVIAWRTRWRWLAIIGGIVYCLYIAFTRLYLGVHYPTDIVGGWMLAMAWTLCAVEGTAAIKHYIAQRRRSNLPSRKA